MTPPEKSAIASHVAVIILCLVVAGCAGLMTWRGMHTVDQVNATLVNINRPCKGPDGPDACGTLAQVNKGVIRMGDLATTAQMQVKQSGVLIAATTKNLDAIGTSVTATMGHLNGTAAALATTASAATDSLHTLSTHTATAIDTANTTLGDLDDAVKLHSAQLANSEADFDAALKPIPAIEVGLVKTTNQLALTSVQITGIATDLHKATSDATKPQPWWRKSLGYGNLGVNIACLATHSCPF
jgi:hypothetical protein